MNKLFKNCKSVIYLNGNICFLRNVNLPIIAADGAYKKLQGIGITPDFVVGDFDSTDINKVKCTTITNYDQNYTDFEKAIHFATSKKLMPAIISGVNGDCLDHVLNNFNIIIRNKCCVYDKFIIAYVVDEYISLKVKPDTKISIIGFSACVSSTGLKWDLNNTCLSFPGYVSCSNRAANDIVNITVHSGSVLVIIYRIQVNDRGNTNV